MLTGEWFELKEPAERPLAAKVGSLGVPPLCVMRLYQTERVARQDGLLQLRVDRATAQ